MTPTSSRSWSIGRPRSPRGASIGQELDCAPDPVGGGAFCCFIRVLSPKAGGALACESKHRAWRRGAHWLVNPSTKPGGGGRNLRPFLRRFGRRTALLARGVWPRWRRVRSVDPCGELAMGDAGQWAPDPWRGAVSAVSVWQRVRGHGGRRRCDWTARRVTRRGEPGGTGPSALREAAGVPSSDPNDTGGVE